MTAVPGAESVQLRPCDTKNYAAAAKSHPVVSRRPATLHNRRHHNPPADKQAHCSRCPYVIGTDGVILFADGRVDYRERTDPLDVLQVLEHRQAAE